MVTYSKTGSKKQRQKVAFLAHCLLNQNAKVYEFARCPGIVAPVVEILRGDGYRLEQLPCPEATFSGMNRWWQGKEQYDTPGYRNHCRNLAQMFVDQMEPYLRNNDEVLIIGLDGSPSSGVRYTGSSPNWGGRPESSLTDYKIVPGMGIWIEELINEIKRRKLPMPKATGILMDDPDFEMTKAVQEFKWSLKRQEGPNQ